MRVVPPENPSSLLMRALRASTDFMIRSLWGSTYKYKWFGFGRLAQQKTNSVSFSRSCSFTKMYFITNLDSTSTILVPTGPQDPTVHLTQSFWMAVAPPIFVANNI